MDKVIIEYKKVDDLIPYENNPRKNDDAVRAVANSIEEFGFKVPIVIDSEGVIVAGHTRLKAAKLLNLDEVPVIVADDLDEDQIKAFRLADNKVGELAEWDFGKLRLEIDTININLGDFGFSDVNLDSLKSADEAPDEFKKYDDDIEVQHRCPKCGYEW